MNRILAAAALGASLAIPAGAAMPGGGDPPAPVVIADFEDPDCEGACKVGGGGMKRVEDPPGGTGHALRWTIEAGWDSSSLQAWMADSRDVTGYGVLRFRIRTDGPRPGALWVRLANSSRSYIGARVRGAGPAWKTVEIDLARMDRAGDFDPKLVGRVDFVVFRPADGAFLVDDIVLDAAPAPDAPAAPPAKGPGAGRPEGKAPRRVTVADFEDPGSEDFVDVYYSAAAPAPAGGKEKGTVLAWTVRPAERAVSVDLHGVPADVREFRTLRFRVRADRAVAESMTVRLQTTFDDVLGADVEGVGPAWRTVELRLPDMRTMGEFDPRRVRSLSFIFFKAPEAVVQIDDVEIETGPGGWQATEQEVLARAFGEDRVRKVRKIPTKHFDVFTDSAAAQSKFPKALEESYEFVKKGLGTPEMEEKLPVYIFQNSPLYVEFAMRFTSYTREQAEKTRGHGSGRYFATYYMAPESSVVVHELTHSIFHRTMGPHGGSWLQEGVATIVEYAWVKQDAAEMFAAELRGGRFVRLKDFMTMPVLLMQEDVKGGAGTAGKLYLQAGAFYEFLVRGPYSGMAEDAIKKLASTPCPDDRVPALVESVLGRTLDAIEKDWVAWGSHPPKVK